MNGILAYIGALSEPPHNKAFIVQSVAYTKSGAEHIVTKQREFYDPREALDYAYEIFHALPRNDREISVLFGYDGNSIPPYPHCADCGEHIESRLDHIKCIGCNRFSHNNGDCGADWTVYEYEQGRCPGCPPNRIYSSTPNYISGISDKLLPGKIGDLSLETYAKSDVTEEPTNTFLGINTETGALMFKKEKDKSKYDS